MGRRKLSDEERERRRERKRLYCKQWHLKNPHRNWYRSLSPEERKAYIRYQAQQAKKRKLLANPNPIKRQPKRTPEEILVDEKIAELKKKSIAEICYVKNTQESERVYR